LSPAGRRWPRAEILLWLIVSLDRASSPDVSARTTALSSNHQGKPERRDGVVEHPLDDDLVLYDTRSQQTYALNRAGALLWSLLGGQTVEGLARELTERYGLAPAQASADVGEFLADLRRAGLVTIG
jgi:PqqD family protein of HPr-rel-A system